MTATAEQPPSQPTVTTTATVKPPAADPIPAIRLFAERMSGKKPLAAEEPKEEPQSSENNPAEAVAEPVQKAQEEPQGAPAKAEPKPKAEKKPKSPTPEEIMERTAKLASETAAETVRKMQEQAPAHPAPEAAAQVEIPEDEARKIAILERMEKDNPSKYRGVSESYAQGVKELVAYQSQWEKANPGKTFDREDTAHDDFFAKHQVDWDDSHFKTAELNAIRDEARMEARREVEDLEKRLKAKELRPQVAQEAAAYTKFMAETVGKEYADVVGANGELDKAALTKLEESDLVAAEALKTASNNTQLFTTEVKLIFSGLEKFNPANPIHQEIERFGREQQHKLLSLPPEKRRTQDGRQFVPLSDFNKLPDREKSNYYTLSGEDLCALWADNEADKAVKYIKKERARVEKLLAAYGKKPAQNGAENIASAFSSPNQVDEQPPAIPVRKVVSPSSNTEPKVAPAQNGEAGDAISPRAAFLRRFIGRT